MQSRWWRWAAAVVGAGIMAGAGLARAADWPQFNGPAGNNTTPQGIPAAQLSDAIKTRWQIPLGSSLGQFVSADGRLFVFQMHGDDEFCDALNPEDGKTIWSQRIDRSIRDREGGDGPRSTPTYRDHRVYVLGTYLKLFCLDAADGHVVWKHDLKEEFGGKEPHWGNAASPIVEGNLVLACGGGKDEAILAFDKTSGAVAWKKEDDQPTHATPVAADIAGVRQVIFFTRKGLVSVKPDTGDVLWRQPFPFNVSTAISPVVCGDDVVYCSAGYGVGGGAYKITKSGNAFTSTELWRKPGGDVNQWSTPIYKDGYLYGLYGFKEFGTEPLKCIDAKTGEEKWSKPGFGQGQVVLVDGNVLVQGDRGELVLVKAQPDRYEELTRAHPITGKCWTDPTVVEGRIYVRSQTGGMCLEVSPK